MPMIKDPRWSVVNIDGTPASGAKMTVYNGGTDTIATAYTDAALLTRGSNPVVADMYGFFPIMYLANGTYKVKIESANGAPLAEVQNVVVT